MFVQYARLRPAELAELRRLVAPDPDRAFDYVDELAEWVDGVPVSAQRGLLVDAPGPDIGGTPVAGTDWGQGPPKVVAPEEVVLAAAGLRDGGELAEFLTAAAGAGDAIVTWLA